MKSTQTYNNLSKVLNFEGNRHSSQGTGICREHQAWENKRNM